MTLEDVSRFIRDCDSVSAMIDQFEAFGWKSEVAWESLEDVGFKLTKPGEKELLIINDHYINYLNIGFVGEDEALFFSGTYPKLMTEDR